MLNRDTWVHETMESVLRSTFLLWQRGHTSGEGQAYMRMHRLNDDDLPHIGVIDPRTGAKLLTLTVSLYVSQRKWSNVAVGLSNCKAQSTFMLFVPLCSVAGFHIA